MHTFQLLIKNAEIVDGTGAEPFTGDLAVKDGRIAEIGALPPEVQAEETLDATGLTLSPGFIDIHTHADIALLAKPQHLPKVMQGVTTEVFTNCGLGFAPVAGEALRIQRSYLGGIFGDDTGVDWQWNTVAELLQRFETAGIGTNAAYLIPHGAVRVSVTGMEARPADSRETGRMVRMVQQGMEEGAWGLSTGLWYAPMSHAHQDETVALCRAAGLFAIHQRDYGAQIFESTMETIDIARKAQVPVQLSHMQLGVKANEGRAADILALLDNAHKQGVDITFDTYPYGAGSTLIQALLPGWATEGGTEPSLQRLQHTQQRLRIQQHLAELERDWSRILLVGVSTKNYLPYEGMPFAQIAAELGHTIPETLCRILEEEQFKACFIAPHTLETDMETFMQHPAHMVGSDGLHLPGKTHPRLFGTFPRILSRYVRERRTLTLPQAVHRITGAPAKRLGIRDRGTLAPGMAADLVLFDRNAVRDTATFEEPLQYPQGIPWVWVNGIAAKRRGEPTGARAGRVLRKQ
jgi:N-acyl-D-amino-acid deacylase